MLVAFSYVTRKQLSLAVKEKEIRAIKHVIKDEKNDNEKLGEILVKMGYLSNNQLNMILKYQPWYKNLFK